jgi:IS30 family transposase
MGRRGPKPDYAKRDRLAELLSRGVSLSEAARTVGVNRRTAKRWRNGRSIKYTDGRVLKLLPVIRMAHQKEYSPRYLSEDERLRLADLRREKRTMREIAHLLGRAPSTISRELRRGSDAKGRYHPFEAHRRALGRRRVQRSSRLSGDRVLREWVADRLQARWSPEQIAHESRRRFPDEPERWLCAETIYQAVYRPDLGGLPRELPGRVLRRRRRQRVPRRDAQRRRSGPVTGMTLVHERDVTVWERAEPGHWEGDLIMGAGNATAIVTLVERTTRFTLLGHLPAGRHDAATVRDSVTSTLGVLPPHARLTLTWDQGTEMARHREIAEALKTTRIFFCDPRSPWQRPSNENTNGVLRDYFPKGSDLGVHTADDLAAVQAELNQRPRKVLAWDNPADRMATLLRTPVLRR